MGERVRRWIEWSVLASLLPIALAVVGLVRAENIDRWMDVTFKQGQIIILSAGLTMALFPRAVEFNLPHRFYLAAAVCIAICTYLYGAISTQETAPTAFQDWFDGLSSIIMFLWALFLGVWVQQEGTET